MPAGPELKRLPAQATGERRGINFDKRPIAAPRNDIVFGAPR